jgi:PII-like signaling protein
VSGESANSRSALKLTTYFGERSRVNGRLLADELIDLHARHEIRSSVLLRGVQGFGAKHRLRTDRLLTLPADLPLVSIALDTNERIEALLADMSAIRREGLVTLERARLFGAGAEAGAETEADLGANELGQVADDTVKLTVYVGRHERVDGSRAFATICEVLHQAGVAGATVLLGVDGTRNGRRERARFFASNASVPLMVMAVGETQRILAALKHVRGLLDEPLFTIERVRMCKRDGQLLRDPHQASELDRGGPTARGWPARDGPAHGEPTLWQKLTIVTSEAARHEHRPVYVELVRRLRSERAAGATSVRGIWGFHGEHPPHGDRLLSIRRHVPVVTVTIDAPERIAALFPIVDELTRERGLVTSELVPIASALHDDLSQLPP